MLRQVSYFIAVFPVLLLTNACGGPGGGSDPSPPALAVTPSPMPTPAPTPAPPPIQNVAALLAPRLTPAPPSPFADVGGQSFATLGAGAQLPLLLTAVSGSFGGDATTTEQGGIVDLGADGSLRLTLNNTALGVGRILLGGSARTAIPGGNIQTFTTVTREGRNYVRSGMWIITNGAGKSGGVWSTGFSPRAASIPTTGRLSYNGPVGGLISEYHIAAGDGIALLKGKLELDSDFLAQTVTGKISGLSVGSNGTYLTGPVNDLTFSATFNATTNRYEGEVVAGPSPGGPNAFLSSARGTIVGQFFGPAATESGAVITLTDGLSRLIISFSATADSSCPGCWDY